MSDVDPNKQGAAVSGDRQDADHCPQDAGAPQHPTGNRSMLERLLRAAAGKKDDLPVEMPFGFDTRVVALWREHERGESMMLLRLVRRVTVLAAAIAILAGAGAYHEAIASRESSEPFTNEFAIADSALEFETSP